MLEQVDGLGSVLASCTLGPNGAAPEDIIHRIGVLCRPSGFRLHELEAEHDCDPAGDLVLQSEQVSRITIEPLGPQMRVALGVD